MWAFLTVFVAKHAFVFFPGLQGNAAKPGRARQKTGLIKNFGAAGRNRTCDPWLRRPILYPLSYSRIRRTVKWHEGYRFSALSSMQSRRFPFQNRQFMSIIEGLAEDGA
jgi:hypothetical protein